jgi:hypothetical protein
MFLALTVWERRLCILCRPQQLHFFRSNLHFLMKAVQGTIFAVFWLQKTSAGDRMVQTYLASLFLKLRAQSRHFIFA